MRGGMKIAYQLGKIVGTAKMWRAVFLLIDELHEYANIIDTQRSEIADLKEKLRGGQSA
jgi:hypothetical protein